MKKITLSFLFVLGALITNAVQAQCVANATLTPTGTPGEFTITDLSYGATIPQSYFQTYVNSTIGTVTIPLQSTTTTGVIQYPANGIYSWGVTYTDSANGCVAAIWDSIVVTGVNTTPAPCQAGFNLMQDSVNLNQYWCWNTSVGSSPAAPITYLWDFGDGSTSTLPYPTHVYSSLGTYTLCLTITSQGGGIACTSTYCDTVVITVKASGTTLNVLPPGAGLSLEENSSIQSLEVYPNPSNGNFVLELNATHTSTIKLSVVNLAGQEIYTELNSVSPGVNVIQLNQASLSTGVYLLQVLDLNTQAKQTIRFLKK